MFCCITQFKLKMVLGFFFLLKEGNFFLFLGFMVISSLPLLEPDRANPYIRGICLHKETFGKIQLALKGYCKELWVTQ